MVCKLASILHQRLDFTLDRCCGLTLVAIYFGTPKHSILLYNPRADAHFLKMLFYQKGLTMSLHFRLGIQGRVQPRYLLNLIWGSFFWSDFFFWYRLKESEEKSSKWESRSEDTHLISSLQDKLSEREEIIKQLAVRFPFMCWYIFWGLLEGSIQSFTHCFRLVLSVLKYFDQLWTNRCSYT